jgi:lysozyme
MWLTRLRDMFFGKNKMRTSQKGQDLIKNFESLRLEGYLPTPNDVLTIGYGSTEIFGRKVKLNESISIEQAQEQFEKDLSIFEDVIHNTVKVQINQNQFDALVSFVYNIGGTNFSKSTLLRLLNENKYEEAADQFLRWNKQAGKVLNGLTRRRQAEKDLFLNKD